MPLAGGGVFRAGVEKQPGIPFRPMKPRFFAHAAAWRDWLAENHLREREILVGFHKTSSGKPSMTWSESVDEALCHGWIDGVRRSIDAGSYSIRFTPRKPGSIWSKVNMTKMDTLIAAGRMQPAGLRAFEHRREERSGIYAFEQSAPLAFDSATEEKFRAHPQAWEFFQRQPPSYRKTAIWRVISGKQETTRARRLEALIQASDAGLRW